MRMKGPEEKTCGRDEMDQNLVREGFGLHRGVKKWVLANPSLQWSFYLEKKMKLPP